MAGTAGSRYIVRKRWVISDSGKSSQFEQTFHLSFLARYYLAMSNASNGFQVLDRKVLAATADFAFLDITTDNEGVDWYFVDAVDPTSASTQSGPTRTLKPSEFTTEKPFSIGSRPAIVLRNDSGNAANVTLIYGRY